MKNTRLETKLEALKKIINSLEEDLLKGVYSEIETPVVEINGEATILGLRKENQKWGLFVKQPNHRRNVCRDWRPLLDVDANLKVHVILEMEGCLQVAIETNQTTLESKLDEVLKRWNYDPKSFT